VGAIFELIGNNKEVPRTISIIRYRDLVYGREEPDIVPTYDITWLDHSLIIRVDELIRPGSCPKFDFSPPKEYPQTYELALPLPKDLDNFVGLNTVLIARL
jgi:hypothetical protein